MMQAMDLQRTVKLLASHCALLGRQGNVVRLALDADSEHLRTAVQEEKLARALSAYFGEPVRLEISLASEAKNTPARQQRAAADSRLEAARSSIENDPNVRAMQDMFGANVQPESVKPAD
jgi:DNA polymerase-3 subunit gamma/tau